MKNVLVTVCNTGTIHKHVVMTLLQMERDKRHNITILLPQHRPYENGLNKIVKEFLEGDYDYWLNMDSDNPPAPRSDPLSCVDLDLDIIGFPTPVVFMKDDTPHDYPTYLNAMDYRDDAVNGWGWNPTQVVAGLKAVDAVGSGCMLIARRVLEGMEKPLFMREWDEDGIVQRGHDFLFCKHAKEQGFNVYCHFDHPCRHFITTDIGDLIRGFHSYYRPNG